MFSFFKDLVSKISKNSINMKNDNLEKALSAF